MSKNGILLPISSLPSRHGIGDFGNNAKDFILWLESHDYSYWQILPINPIGPGNSPYMTSCSQALDPRYISLDLLIEEKLLDNNVPSFDELTDHVRYYEEYQFKEVYLKKAFNRFKKEKRPGLKTFIHLHSWVIKFATFLVFDELNEHRPWNQWPIEQRDYFKTHNNPPRGYKKEIEYIIFLQYIAIKQWTDVLNFAHAHGVKIIGDVPFYVGYSSADCWIHRDVFDLDENYNPRTVAGCPPDAFSELGQLWGNPTYNFKEMKRRKFSFLINRLIAVGKTCDIVRLDHFRAFDAYYAIPAGASDARVGEWRNGPSYDFFDEFFKRNTGIELIAEDLGFMTDSVYALRDHYNLPGMNISQFTICDNNWVNKENMIVYSGTHDNETSYGHFIEMNMDGLNETNRILGTYPNVDAIFNSFMLYTKELPSKMTIIPMQDYLKLDNRARMNTPAVSSDSNWAWKLIKLPD